MRQQSSSLLLLHTSLLDLAERKLGLFFGATGYRARSFSACRRRRSHSTSASDGASAMVRAARPASGPPQRAMYSAITAWRVGNRSQVPTKPARSRRRRPGGPSRPEPRRGSVARPASAPSGAGWIRAGRSAAPWSDRARGSCASGRPADGSAPRRWPHGPTGRGRAS